MIILTGKTDSYAQFITVLFIFVAVLAVTRIGDKMDCRISETAGRQGILKYWRPFGSQTTNISSWFALAKAYFAIAVCKDTVTNQEKFLQNS